MPDKPTTAAGYPPGQLQRVRATCLYTATKLGDLMNEIVVVGGLVPSLLISQAEQPAGASPYAGTMDLDLGLALALVNDERYQEISERLRRAGFEPDVNEKGKPTRQRWKISNPPVKVDFLIETEDAEKRAGGLMNLEHDFAAFIVPGLHLAFTDRKKITLHEDTILGEEAKRDVWVCGPGAFVILKSLAFHLRGENKDAYDLFYVLRNYGDGVADVASCLMPLLNDGLARRAMEYLQSDFLNPKAIGPKRVAEFELGRRDADEPARTAVQADVAGFVRRLLEECKL
jgi:hypothetical protein